MEEKRIRADIVKSMVQITMALSVCHWLPIRPQIVTPLPALGIHLMSRGLVNSWRVQWSDRIGPKEKREPRHDGDHCYMQSRLEVQGGRHRRDRSLYRAGTHLHTDNNKMTTLTVR